MSNKIFIISLLLPLFLTILVNGEDQIAQEQNLIELKLQYHSYFKLFYAVLGMGKENIQEDFKFLIDTGSISTWVYQEGCNNCTQANGVILKRQCEGNSCDRRKDQQETIYYGIGDVTFYQTDDYIRINENGQTTPVLVNIGHVSDLNKLHKNYPFNGLMGLAPGNDIKINKFVSSLVNNTNVNQTIFSINFRQDDSSLVIGGIREDLIPKEKQIPTFQKAKGEDQWRIEIEDIRLGQKHSIFYENIQLSQNQTSNDQTNQIQPIDNQEKYDARFDSGANMIVVENEVGERIRDIFKSEYGMICFVGRDEKEVYYNIYCDCGEGRLDNFPPMTFHFLDSDEQEVTYTLNPNQYVDINMNQPNMCKTKIFVQTPISQDQKQKDNQKSQNNTNKNRPYLLNEVILGQPFLQNKLGVFNIESGEIGLVELEPYQPQVVHLAFTKFIAVGLLIILVCFFAALRIIKQLN